MSEKRPRGRPPTVTPAGAVLDAMIAEVGRLAAESVRQTINQVARAAGFTRVMVERLDQSAISRIESAYNAGRDEAERQTVQVIHNFIHKGESLNLSYKQVMAAQWLLEHGFGWSQRLIIESDPVIRDRNAAVQIVENRVLEIAKQNNDEMDREH